MDGWRQPSQRKRNINEPLCGPSCSFDGAIHSVRICVQRRAPSHNPFGRSFLPSSGLLCHPHLPNGQEAGGTILAAIIGLIFLGTPSAGSNFSPHITASVIVNGLVFDLYLQYSGGSLLDPSRKHLVVAGTLGNLAMAPTGLLILQAIFGISVLGPSPTATWAIALVGDTLAGAAGAFFGTIVVERVKGLQARRVLEAESAVRVRV